MKKNVFLVSFFALVFTACQQPETKTIDTQADKAAISNILNLLQTAFKEQNVDTLISVFTDDAILYGSDPSEIWDKQQIKEMWAQMLSEPVELSIIGEPVIKLATDGNSAYAAQQYYMPMFSNKIVFRNGYHLIKLNGEWKIFTCNTACIIKNEDLPKIDEVLNN